MHETSKRLSQTLRDIYESDWNGVEELPVITEVSLGCVSEVRAFGSQKMNVAIISHPVNPTAFMCGNTK